MATTGIALWLALWGSNALAAPTNTIGVRYRRGGIPGGIMDTMFFDRDDPDALPYDRPKIAVDIFGLEYTLSPAASGPGLQIWVERAAMPMGPGYFDDKENPADHSDGTWVVPDRGLGGWALGANYRSVIGITPASAPAALSFTVGVGLGLAVRTGGIQIWQPGFHPDVSDPDCGYELPAPQRAESCAGDGELKLPGVIPVLDLTMGPELRIAERGMVRVDFGIHDVLYVGAAAGATF